MTEGSAQGWDRAGQRLCCSALYILPPSCWKLSWLYLVFNFQNLAVLLRRLWFSPRLNLLVRLWSDCTKTLNSPLPSSIIYSSAFTYFLFFFKHNPFPFCGKGNGHTCFRCCRPKTKADMENENKSDQPPHNIGTIVTQRNRLIAWLGPSQRFHLRLFHALAGYCNSMMGLIFVGSCGFVSRCNGTEERRTQPFIFCKIR